MSVGEMVLFVSLLRAVRNVGWDSRRRRRRLVFIRLFLQIDHEIRGNHGWCFAKGRGVGIVVLPCPIVGLHGHSPGMPFSDKIHAILNHIRSAVRRIVMQSGAGIGPQECLSSNGLVIVVFQVVRDSFGFETIRFGGVGDFKVDKDEIERNLLG